MSEDMRHGQWLEKAPKPGETYQDVKTKKKVSIVTSHCMMVNELPHREAVWDLPLTIYVYHGQKLHRVMAAPHFMERFAKIEADADIAPTGAEDGTP